MKTIKMIFIFFLWICSAVFFASCSTFSKPIELPQIIYSNQFQSSNQLVLVKTTKNNCFKAKVILLEKINNKWRMIYAPMPAVVGRNGIALEGQKKEGDGHTPSGIYKIDKAFGYSKNLQTGLEYRQVTQEDIWVDDLHSTNYNRWIKMKDKEDALSFEKLKRDDNLYEAAAVIEYNTDPVVPGAGSAIFLHIWRNKNHSTSGCVALSKQNVLKILKWLNRKENPIIVISG